MTDVIIIGGGPAGVTAALYTSRAALSTTILYKDHGALQTATVKNFYGHLEIGGKELVNIGLKQAKSVGAKVAKQEAVSIVQNQDGTFLVETTKASHSAKAVLIATGASRTTARIKGLSNLEGRGVSYCAICDGFFHKGKDVAVIGTGAYAQHEVQDLLGIAKSVTVLTNGKRAAVKFPENVTVITQKISEIYANSGIVGDILGGVTFANGEKLPLSGLFVALGVAGGTELARKIGAAIDSNAISVNENMQTSVPNLWAAGDCTLGIKQIAKAVHDGAEAGMDIVRALKAAKK